MTTRILIVEDDLELLARLERFYTRIFATEGYESVVQTCSSAEEAREIVEAAQKNPFDFVSLDVNLGHRAMTGMHVLKAMKAFASAWMVALLTGVEADASTDNALGTERADELRKQLRREAYENFPAERLLVVEKPSSFIPDEEAHDLLINRLKQIVSVYAVVTRLRYVFRPIDVKILERKHGRKGQPPQFVESYRTHWQIRFNCGEIRTLPHTAGFRMLHHLLKQPANERITAEELLSTEPTQRRATGLPAKDAVAEYFTKRGVNWAKLRENEQQRMIDDLVPTMREYLELRRLASEAKITPIQARQLKQLKKQLGAMCMFAERAADDLSQTVKDPNDEEVSLADRVGLPEMAQAGLHIHGGNYDKLSDNRRGKDSPEAELCRTRMKRVRDYLRENGFADFAEHIAKSAVPQGARYSYAPPEGVEWTT